MPSIPRNMQKMDKQSMEDINKLTRFLDNHKVDENAEKSHTAFGPPWGRYYIDDDDFNTFFNLYKRALIAYKRADIKPYPLHIVERQLRVGPIIVDLDFRQETEKRQYTIKTIKYIVKKYTECINKYLRMVSVGDDDAFIFEKDHPTYDDKQNNYKDGFHIMYPDIIVDAGLRHKILMEVKSQVESENGLSDINYVNSLEAIFDKSIIMSNGWCMYGSMKHKGQPYTLTYVFNKDLIEQNKTYTDDELVILLSLRNHDQDELTPYKSKYDTDEFKSEIKTIYENNYGNNKKNKKQTQAQLNKDVVKEKLEKITEKVDNDEASRDEHPFQGQNERKPGNNWIQNSSGTNGRDVQAEIAIARKLTAILSKKRATEYHSWIRVGWALRNIDESLLDSFIEFSKKCPELYNKDPTCCERYWGKAKEDGYTIASLYWWAKEDNPIAYLDILRTQVNKLITEAESGTHDDIAKVVYELYKFNYRCASIQKNVWYEFQKHKWVRIDSGYTLANKLSDEVTNEFAKLVSQYYAESIQKQGLEKDHLMNKAKSISKIIDKLKNQAFKSQILSACSNRFYDAHFEERLDGKTHLLGCNNGVIDLKNNCFRPGIPDDYITMTTGYDWKEFKRNDPEVQEVEEFFRKVMREEDMRQYILTLLSSYLDGENKDQKFILWTGSGGNGKSKTIDLMRYTLGDYFGILPISILTKKRAAAGNATPELADKRGKRFLAIQEPEHDDTIYVGLMKELTGSDWITARALYGDLFMYKPQFKLVLTCNKLPQIPSHDGGTWRRLRVSPWESEFVDEPRQPNQFPKDPELEKKLKRWNQPLLWLLLKVYYPLYCADKLKEPAKVTQFTNKYKKDTDIYFEFLDATFTNTKNHDDYETTADMYSSFKGWFTESYSSTKTKFPSKKEFVNYLTEVASYTIDNGKVRGVQFTNKDVVV